MNEVDHLLSTHLRHFGEKLEVKRLGAHHTQTQAHSTHTHTPPSQVSVISFTVCVLMRKHYGCCYC